MIDGVFECTADGDMEGTSECFSENTNVGIALSADGGCDDGISFGKSLAVIDGVSECSTSGSSG